MTPLIAGKQRMNVMWNQGRCEMKKAEVIMSSFLEVDRGLALEAAYGRLSRQVAHDLRSPLGAFKVALQNLKRDKNTFYNHRSEIELAEQANDRIDEILSLLLHRPKSAVVEITEVHSVIDEALSFVSGRQQKPSIRIVRNYNIEPVYVHQPKVNLLRILINLFENAFDAVDVCGEILITTDVRAGRVELSIKDNGQGIAPEDLSRIFERGFTKGKSHGTGEGLSIVEELVFGGGGALGVNSRPSVGTEVLVWFPVWTQGPSLGGER